MILKPRSPISVITKLRNAFWPDMGWARWFRYTKLRILRIADSERNIAVGLTIGAAISFTPFVGLHMVGSAALAYLFRVNILAALIGTLVGNPWTFPFIWFASADLGSVIFKWLGYSASVRLPDTMSLSVLFDLIRNNPMQVFLPWLAGGLLLAFASIPLFYGLFYLVVKKAKRTHRRARLKRRRKKRDLERGQS